MICYILLLH
nr:unnamed protein product [Callosobruchus chinensis]